MAGAPAVPGKMAADLGPGYQAALALSFLSDTDDREDRDVEKEPGIAEQWLAQTESRPSALAEVAEIRIKSPFAEPKQAQAFRDGGEAKGDSRSWLEKFYQADKDMARMPRLPTSPLGVAVNAGYEAYKYVTESDPLNDLKKELKKRSGREVDTGSEPMDQEEKKSFPVPRADGGAVTQEGDVQYLAGGGLPFMPTPRISPSSRQQLDSIKAQFDKYNADVDAYNAGTYTAYEPVAPSTTPAQYEALGNAAQKAARDRGLALQVMAAPEQFGFSLNKMFAEGGEVKEMQDAARKGEAYQALEKYLKSRDEMPSIKTSDRMPDDMYGMFTSDNLGIGSGTVKISNKTPKAALASVLTHEVTHAADRQMTQQAIEQGMFGKSNQYTEAYKKLVGPESRNRTELARTLKPEWADDNRYYRSSPKEIAAHGVGAFAGPNLQTRAPRHVDATAATELMVLMDLAQRNVDKGPKGLEKIPAFLRKTAPYGYADGGDVQLTPQQIERIAAQEAAEREIASKPAFLTPKSGKGRQISTKTGELEMAALQGVSEMPYLLAGAPVDLATMAMRPFGYDVEKPMGGSEDLKQRALDAGIRKAPPEGKAARALYELTQAGASAVNPAAPVRGAVKAAEKTGEAAKMLAEDFMQYNRQLSVPGASYAVRNKGTPVVIEPKRPVTTDDFHFSMSDAELRAFKERNPDVALYSEREMAATPEFQAFAAKANTPVDAAEAFVKEEVATTPDPTLNGWFMKALPRYLRSDFASPQDQLVRAAEEGKMLHLAPKKFSDYSDVDTETAKLLKAKAQDNKNARRTEGFLPEGETKTDYGQRIESLTDIAAYPEQIGDLTPARVPPSMRNLVETNPEARVMDFAPDIGGILKLPELRDKMLEIRALGPKAEYSAYGQAPAQVPDEFLLPDDTLAKLNVAAASNRVARFTRWQDEARQAMATTALRSDPKFKRQPLQDGKYIGVELPDVDVYPKYMPLVNDVGCDGGWCTQGKYTAQDYGSGDSRLHVIVTGEGKTARPAAQFAVEQKMNRGSLDGVPFEIPKTSITEIKTAGNGTDFKNSPALPAIQQYVQSLDKQYGGLQFVDQLGGLGMKQLPKNPMELLNLFDGFRARSQLAKAFGSEQEGFKLVRDELIKINNGSQYTTGNEDEVAGLIDQAVRNVLAPRQRANGGMVERQSTDGRKYL
jgi:hypothetical protein